jgi:hypothetical protein
LNETTDRVQTGRRCRLVANDRPGRMRAVSNPSELSALLREIHECVGVLFTRRIPRRSGLLRPIDAKDGSRKAAKPQRETLNARSIARIDRSLREASNALSKTLSNSSKRRLTQRRKAANGKPRLAFSVVDWLEVGRGAAFCLMHSHWWPFRPVESICTSLTVTVLPFAPWRLGVSSSLSAEFNRPFAVLHFPPWRLGASSLSSGESSSLHEPVRLRLFRLCVLATWRELFLMLSSIPRFRPLLLLPGDLA